MKILFLSQLLPFPLDAGPKIRSYYVLRYLASRGHDITLVALTRNGDRAEDRDHLKEFCRSVVTVPIKRSIGRELRSLLTSVTRDVPFIVARDEVSPLRQLIRNLVRDGEFDAVHSDQLWMAPYALEARGSSQIPRAILDQHNAVFQVIKRLAATEKNPLKRSFWRSEGRRLAHYEKRVCSQFDRVVWVTDLDRSAMLRAGANGGNGCGSEAAGTPADLVIPISVDPEQNPPIRRPAERRRGTFLGGLHWPPNAQGVEWFIQNSWQEVRRRFPEAVLTIIGKKPPRALKARAQADSSIEVTGYVPDPSRFLEETAVFIVPLLSGGGMRVKILDAWCWGLPLVTTTIGGEGLQIRHGMNALVADDSREFGSAVSEILEDSALGSRLAASGRSTAESEYDWRINYQKWDQVYRPDR